LASNESGFKYFILGSVASAILLFGITLVYGATGSFDLAVISNFIQDGSETSIIMNVGITMILVGFLFKISAAPFHIWTPDVYQGAPTWITAFMSTLVKAAAMVALFKLFTGPFHYYVEANGYIIGVIAAITLIASNTAALWQTDVKRMLAYSSISHAGFLLSTIIGNASLLSLLFYLLTYSIAGLIAFGVIKETQTLEGNPLKGLYRRNSVLAFAFTAALLSMAGIPPFSGFIAKYFVIAQLIEAKYFALVVVMIITSAIGAFYYLRSSLSVYQHIENAGRIVLTPLVKWTYIILSALLVLLTVAAGYMHNL
jgi:NADH-quinone oxidoreductase subunit N